MIDQIEFKNFKALHDVTIKLGRLTALVGANGVGKTTVLDGLEAILKLASPPRTGNSSARAHLASALGEDLDSWQTNGSNGELSVAVRRKGASSLAVRYAPQLSRDSNGARGLTFETNHGRLEGDQIDFAFFSAPPVYAFASVTRLRLDPGRLARPSPAASEVPKLEPDGAGLATVLNHLASQRDGKLDAIEAALAALVPGFQRVRPRPERADNQNGHGFLLVFEKDGEVPASHVSEGTLLLLGLLTAIHDQPTRVLLLDDIERGLHPVAQQRFVEHIYGVLAANRDLQIVVTTHSPDAINACRPEDIRVLSRAPDGNVHVNDLGNHPEAAKWLKVIRPGEFWSTVGEDWVAER